MDPDTFHNRVISMTDRDRARRLRPLRQIEGYWQDLADRAGAVPSRDAIDPRGIQDALEHAFIAQRIAPGQARFRVAGSHLGELLGMEVSGLPLSALLVPAGRSELATCAEAVFAEGRALRADLLAVQGFGRGPLLAHLMLLPLTSDSGDRDRALGGLVTLGRIGRAPRRFEVVSLRTTATKIAAPPAIEVARGPAAAGFAEARAAFATPGPRTTRHNPGHLRLVVSND